MERESVQLVWHRDGDYIHEDLGGGLSGDLSVSLGFIVSDDDEEIVLSPTSGPAAEGAGFLHIPKRNVLEVEPFAL